MANKAKTVTKKTPRTMRPGNEAEGFMDFTSSNKLARYWRLSHQMEEPANGPGRTSPRAIGSSERNFIVDRLDTFFRHAIDDAKDPTKRVLGRVLINRD
jgi:hypothetical protein